MNLDAQLDVIDLCTLAQVKELIPQASTDTSADARITSLIGKVSAEIGRYLGFHLSTVTDRTETYMMRPHQNVLRLDAKNLSSVTSVKYTGSNPTDWSVIAALNATGYIVNNPGGWIRFLSPRTSDPGLCQVVYTGGFGATTPAIQAAFPDLSQACALQVKYLNERLATLGGDVTTIPGASTTFNSEYRLLRSVQDLLAQHRRGRV